MTAIPVEIRGVRYDAASAAQLSLTMIDLVEEKYGIDLATVTLREISLRVRMTLALLVLQRVTDCASMDDVLFMKMGVLDKIVETMIFSAKVAPLPRERRP